MHNLMVQMVSGVQWIARDQGDSRWSSPKIL